MNNTAAKFAGWLLCIASVLLLARYGRLELLVVLLPMSLMFSYLSAGKKEAEARARKR